MGYSPWGLKESDTTEQQTLTNHETQKKMLPVLPAKEIWPEYPGRPSCSTTLSHKPFIQWACQPQSSHWGRNALRPLESIVKKWEEGGSTDLAQQASESPRISSLCTLS